MNMIPVGIQFICQYGSQPRVGTLPHFQMLGEHRHAVVCTDTQKGIGFESGCRCIDQP